MGSLRKAVSSVCVYRSVSARRPDQRKRGSRVSTPPCDPHARTHAQAGESAEADVTGPASRSTGRPPGILCDIHEVPAPSFQRSVHSTTTLLAVRECPCVSVGRAQALPPSVTSTGYGSASLRRLVTVVLLPAVSSIDHHRWSAHLICVLAVAGPAGTRLHAAAAVAAFVHDATSDRPRHVPVHHGTRAPWELCTSDCPYFWAVPCCANSWP